MIKFSSIYIAHNYYKTTNDKEEGKKKKSLHRDSK